MGLRWDGKKGVGKEGPWRMKGSVRVRVAGDGGVEEENPLIGVSMSSVSGVCVIGWGEVLIDPSTPSALVGTSIWDSTISILTVRK